MPQRIEEGEGFLKGKPCYPHPAETSILYRTIADELGEAGTIPVAFEPACDEEYSGAAEGYVLTVAKDGITVCAAAPQGHFYGALTLVQLIRQFGENLPCMKIFDRPVMEFRAGACEHGHGMFYRAEWFKRWIRKLAFQKANHMFISTNVEINIPTMAGFNFGGSMNADDARELCAYAKRYNVKLVPAVSVQGHFNEVLSLQYFNDLRETMEGEESTFSTIATSICPNNLRAVELIRSLIDDMLDCFDTDLLLVGGDEIYTAGGDAACRDSMRSIGKTGIILSNFIRFRDYLESKGVRMGIWGDMIVSLSGENRYDGNIEEARFRDSNFYLLNELRRNTIIFDWWYVGGSRKSQQFFSENGFQVVASSSTHACMMHFASPQQQVNIWKLFKGACDYKFYGCMVTDWINMYGYQSEQTLFNQAAGLDMAWKGCDGNFIDGVTRSSFERALSFQEYHTTDSALTEYYHLAGDLYGDLLRLFSVKNRGVALRKVFFYEDNPMLFYIKFSVDLEGKLPQYLRAVERLEALWERIKQSVPDDGYREALHMPALLQRYLYENYAVFDRIYPHYDAAAKAQYRDRDTFIRELEACAEILGELCGKSRELLDFTLWMQEKLGLNDASELRIAGREENILKLQRYFRYLKNGKRPLPVLKLISDTLFHTPVENWWQEHFYDMARQEGEFRRYDIDRGQIYESMDWEIPLNR